MNHKVFIKRIGKGRLPEYRTDGAACADCYCRIETETVEIPPQCTGLIPLGFAIDPGEGFETVLEPRSSFALKYHGLIVHGEIDSDYRGELKACVYNTDKLKHLIIRNGDRICQLKLQPVHHMDFAEVTELSETKRGEGGFGSTGN